MDHYEVLGVPRDASRKEIKRAYKALAAKTHPDKSTGNKDTHQALTVAYNVLIDDRRRETYDRTGETSQGAVPERWEALIMSIFDVLISQDFKGDIVREAKARMISASAENQACKSQFEQSSAALRKKLGRVKTTGGATNYFEALIAQKIGILETRAKACGEEIGHLTKAIDGLATYADTSPEQPSGPPRWYSHPGGVATRETVI